MILQINSQQSLAVNVSIMLTPNLRHVAFLQGGVRHIDAQMENPDWRHEIHKLDDGISSCKASAMACSIVIEHPSADRRSNSVSSILE